MTAPLPAVAFTLPHARPARRRVLWAGGVAGPELTLARESVAALGGASLLAVDDLPADGPDAVPDPPLCILLAHDRTTSWTPARVLALSRRWPLARVVSVAGSLGDGRRRSGPLLPGVEEIAWHDIAGRLAAWFADLDAGAAGSLGLPPTARREDRLLDAPSFAAARPRRGGRGPVAVVGRDEVALEGLAGLVATLGYAVSGQIAARPAIDGAAGTVLWDAVRLLPDDIEWLRLLVANRPGAAVVILDSFPRGDVAGAARDAGAAAILARPVALEPLAGTLERLVRRRDAA